MYWMVPTISGLIVGGFSMGALASMTGGITGRTAKGEAVGAEMGTGSWQSGNVRMNNTAMNKHDTAMLSSIGAMSNVVQGSQGNFGNAYNNQTVSNTMGTAANTTGQNLSGASQILDGVVIGNFSQTAQVKTMADGRKQVSGTFTGQNGDTTVAYTGDAILDANNRIVSGSNLQYQATKGDSTSTTGKVSFADGQMTSAEVKRSDGFTENITRSGDGFISQMTGKDGSTSTWRLNENGEGIEFIGGKSSHYTGASNFSFSRSRDQARAIEEQSVTGSSVMFGKTTKNGETLTTGDSANKNRATDLKVGVDMLGAFKTDGGTTADMLLKKTPWGAVMGGIASGADVRMGYNGQASTQDSASSGKSASKETTYTDGRTRNDTIGEKETFSSSANETRSETIQGSDAKYIEFMNEKLKNGMTPKEIMLETMNEGAKQEQEYKEWLIRQENKIYDQLNTTPQSQKITQNTEIPHNIDTWQSAVDCVFPNLHIFPNLKIYDRTVPYAVAAYVLEPSSTQKQVLSCVDSKSKKEVLVDLSPFERFEVTDKMTIILVAIEYGDGEVQILRDIKAVGKDSKNTYRLTIGSSVYKKDYLYNRSDFDDQEI